MAHGLCSCGWEATPLILANLAGRRPRPRFLLCINQSPDSSGAQFAHLCKGLAGWMQGGPPTHPAPDTDIELHLCDVGEASLGPSKGRDGNSAGPTGVHTAAVVREGCRDTAAKEGLSFPPLPSPTQPSPVQFSSVTVMSDSLRSHGFQHTRPPCPSPTTKVYSNSCLLCLMSESPSGKREGFQDNATDKKGKLITDSSQGPLPHPTKWCRSESP